MVDIMVLLENSLHPNIASNRGINLKIVKERHKSHYVFTELISAILVS